MGVKCTVQGVPVLVGNRKLMEAEGIEIPFSVLQYLTETHQRARTYASPLLPCFHDDIRVRPACGSGVGSGGSSGAVHR